MILIAAVFAERLAPSGPTSRTSPSACRLPGSTPRTSSAPTGRRDILSRLIYGARVSLLVGVIAVGLSCPLGVVVGLVAG